MNHLLQKLGVSQRLGLVSLLFLIPDAVLLTLFIVAINGHVDFASLERQGNQFQQPLEELLRLLPEHHWALQDSAGAPGPASEPRLKAEEIDRAFESLAGLDVRMGESLQFTAEGLAKRDRGHLSLDKVRGRWRVLRDRSPRPPSDQSAREHNQLIADVRGMITHAGDNSNLILDPDLDTYYLMDVTLLALPQTQERMVHVINLTRELLTRQARSARDRAEVHAQVALLKEADLDRIEGSGRTALREDANFYGKDVLMQQSLPAVLKAYSDGMNHFIKLLDEVTEPDGAVDAKKVWEAGRRARGASFALWNTASHHLDQLLQRRISHYRWRRASSFILSACALCAALSLVAFVNRSIRVPLQRQADALQKTNKALRTEITERCNAELRLKEAHAKLMVASREAGMAEVATGVLHNVGNVLNSVNISVAQVRDAVEQSRVSQLVKASALLRSKGDNLSEFLTQDPQGRRFPEFLEQLTEHLRQENASLLKEAADLDHNVNHIKQIVSAQQAFAKMAGVIETLDPQVLVEEALRLNSSAFERHHVRIERQFTAAAAVSADRHKVLQILVNLIQNARQAVCDLSREKRITLIVRPSPSGNVQIAVRDNGVGIPPEILPQIFQHGFTTRADGHGFGLHSSALSAQEMHCTLEAHSDGQDQGATFVLELPGVQANLTAAA